MNLDVYLEILIGVLAFITAFIVHNNNKKVNLLFFGFVLLVVSAVFDVVDEFFDHLVLDILGKGGFVAALVVIIIVLNKINAK